MDHPGLTLVNFFQSESKILGNNCYIVAFNFQYLEGQIMMENYDIRTF
jgi:hypothetical protein